MPKLLCLPGFLQSGRVFAEKSSGLRNSLGKKYNYELKYLDPPVIIPNRNRIQFQLAETEEEAITKWEAIKELNCNRCWWLPEGSNPYGGFELSLETVIQHIKANGPYDGIVGFLQGAAMAAIVSNSITLLLPEHDPFRVAVLFSPFVFVTPVHSADSVPELNSEITDLATYREKVSVFCGFEKYFSPRESPTRFISIFGTEDSVVPQIRTEYFNSLYPEIEVMKHNGGHYVPNHKVFLEPLLDSIRKAVEAHPSF